MVFQNVDQQDYKTRFNASIAAPFTPKCKRFCYIFYVRAVLHYSLVDLIEQVTNILMSKSFQIQGCTGLSHFMAKSDFINQIT